MSTEHVSPETPVSRVAIVTGGASGSAWRSRSGSHRTGTPSPCSTAMLTVPPRRPHRSRRPAEAALGLGVDVTDRVGIERGVAEVNERPGDRRILVNNAGLPWTERFHSIDVAAGSASST